MGHSLRFVAVAVALVAAAGCSNRYIDEAQSITPQGSAFETALASDYLAMAKSEHEYGDVRDTDTFARRSTAAAEGQLVLPDNLSNRKISSGDRAELLDARERLISVLDENGRTTAPEAAASAQVLYDCWVEQAEESLQRDDLKACRDGFQTEISRVEAAVAAAAVPAVIEPTAYLTFFDLNSAELSPQALEVVAQAADVAIANPDTLITVTGFTDTTGSPQYNLRLSERRAETVATAMVSRGVDPARIMTEGVGENNLLVPTGDGVAEPQNRRAEIALGG